MDPSHMLHQSNTSCDIPNLTSPIFQVIIFNLAILATMLIFRNSNMSTYMAPFSHSGSWEPSILSSTLITPRFWLTACPSLSWMTAPSSTISKRKCLTTLPTVMLNIVGDYNPPLGGDAGRPDLGGMINSLSCDHLLVLPKLLQIVKQFRACPVTLQGL